jgi:hypothetical protein
MGVSEGQEDFQKEEELTLFWRGLLMIWELNQGPCFCLCRWVVW